jgi:hypothetical protein
VTVNHLPSGYGSSILSTGTQQRHPAVHRGAAVFFDRRRGDLSPVLEKFSSPVITMAEYPEQKSP